MHLAARTRRIEPSASVPSTYRRGTVLDLTLGEPDFDTPDHVKAAASAAISRGDTKYTPARGTLALRTAVSGKLLARTGITHRVEDVLVSGGAKQVVFLALMATVDAGAEVIVPAPYWVSYPDMVRVNGGTPVVVATDGSTGFKLTPDRLRSAISPRTRWLVLNNPVNPTGAVYTEAELAALARVLLAHPHVGVLADEIYDEIRYDAIPVASVLSVEPALADRTLVVNGVSKTYAMTGWRIGYGAGPGPLIAAMTALQSHISSCPSSIGQAAATAALTGPQGFVGDSVRVYRDRRDRAVSALAAVPGLTFHVPDGGFYLFLDCTGVLGGVPPSGERIGTDRDLAAHLLDAEGVAVTPGTAYGAPGHLRLSFAAPTEVVDEAVQRIRRAIERITRT